MDIYVIWATDANMKLYKFIHAIHNDNRFSDEIDKFIDDVYDRLGNGCHIDIMIKQDAIEFEGTITDFDNRRHVK